MLTEAVHRRKGSTDDNEPHHGASGSNAEGEDRSIHRVALG